MLTDNDGRLSIALRWHKNIGLVAKLAHHLIRIFCTIRYIRYSEEFLSEKVAHIVASHGWNVLMWKGRAAYISVMACYAMSRPIIALNLYTLTDNENNNIQTK